MAPIQATGAVTISVGSAKIRSAGSAKVLAISVFWARPMTKMRMPSATPSMVSRRPCSSPTMVLKRTMGPAISCGNMVM